MRAFVFGLIVGACACFAVLRIVDPPLAQPALVEPLPVRPPQAVGLEPNKPPSCPDVANVNLAHAKQPERKATPAQPAARDDGNSQAVPSAQVTVEKKSIQLEDLSEKAAAELCIQAERLRHQRELDAKADEPKDAGWAYSMEQLIRQHLESHVPADKYKILQLECRTTFCELRMEGSDKVRSSARGKGRERHSESTVERHCPQGRGRRVERRQLACRIRVVPATTEFERRMWLRQRN